MDKLAIIDGMDMKNRRVIILAELQKGVLEQLNISPMCIEKTKLLERESVYWVNMNSNIENAIKYCIICPEFQQS